MNKILEKFSSPKRFCLCGMRFNFQLGREGGGLDPNREDLARLGSGAMILLGSLDNEALYLVTHLSVPDPSTTMSRRRSPATFR